jgi:hypothetical protein
MTKLSLVCVGVLMCVGCGTTLTKEGSEVRIVTEHEREIGCTGLGVVAGSDLGSRTIDTASENTMKDVRNNVAKMGGNAMRILPAGVVVIPSDRITIGNQTVNSGTWFAMSDPRVEALRCDFGKIDAKKAKPASQPNVPKSDEKPPCR